MTRLVVLVLLPLLVIQPSRADINFGIGVRAGDFGVGVEGTWQPSVSWIDLRIGAKSLELDEPGNANGLPHSSKLALRNYYATANLLLPRSPLRLTAGLYNFTGEAEVSSQAPGTLAAGGIPASARDAAALRRDSYFAGTAPYLGVGFDYPVTTRLDLNLDLGVLWQGESTFSPDASRMPGEGSLGDRASMQERRQLLDALRDYKAWPAVSLGLVFNFK